jgi:prepilin-type N-terminal cleavage/methylation domain-containing protein
MVRGRFNSEQGMTLVEVTLAVAIFATVIALTAQSLVDFYVGVDLQKQRIEAANSCRAVLSYLRERRTEMSEDFPKTFLAHIREQQEDGWTDFVKDYAVHGRELDGHAITVVCTSMTGADASDTDNPIRVHVRSTWNDRKGRLMRAEVATCFTDR